MRDLLKKGYTLYISKSKNNVTGIGLKKLDDGRGITMCQIDKDKANVLDQMPGISSKLNEGETLLISRDFDQPGVKYHARFGKQSRQGPYGEEDCFITSINAEDEEFLGVLLLINEKASKMLNPIEPPKIFIRNYGETNYKEKK